MLSIPANATIDLAVEPVDMRKSFDGLLGLVTAVFQQNVFDGHDGFRVVAAAERYRPLARQAPSAICASRLRG